MKISRVFLILLAAFPATSLPLPADEAKPVRAATAVVQDVTPSEAEQLIKNTPKILVLDVRTPEEFAKGHIPGAKNIDFLGDGFAGAIKGLDPKTPILLHCASGGRSTQALEALRDRPTIYHLKDGFKAWEKAGKAVEK